MVFKYSTSAGEGVMIPQVLADPCRITFLEMIGRAAEYAISRPHQPSAINAEDLLGLLLSNFTD